MRQKIHSLVGFLRTTAVGGLIFLFPLFVLIFILGYLYSMVAIAFEAALPYFPANSIGGFFFILAIAIAILLAVCFFGGLIAQRAIGRKFSSAFEKKLTTVFPKYLVYKDLFSGNLGGDRALPSLKPITVQVEGLDHLAFEADRLEDGNVVAFLPGAPDAWNGRLIVVPADRVSDANISFNETLSVLEQLGRNSRDVMSRAGLVAQK
ncbi:hypothetical protein [Calycomorphotria hydatis]|uniref:DUF502 domain-containing protein n=1 Tax=Calycomorphotria hydatis TaxID=2528027 RepID=A0A517T475_9PLAN|nr:hypothetical protein [Calycomorphotria hydatis]QDT63161.1 hypothetical protein V22_03790 [Calycomorphotria hydatis]